LLRVTGLKVWDVELIRLDEDTEPEDYLPLMEAAGLLGARRLKTVCDSDDEGLAAALLSRLAELAAPFGLTVDLEYMVFSGVKSFGTALAVTSAASQPNLQVLVDALHCMRAGDTVGDVRAAPAGSIGYCQLCDGPRQAPVGREALITEARTRRLPPGLGEFPLRALLDVMPPDCPVSIEVPLPPGADPGHHARRLLAAARKVLEKRDAP
jgi:sugar phosphate isomerase/epimerase